MIEPKNSFDRYAISLTAPSKTQKAGIFLLAIGIIACIVGAAIPGIGTLTGHTISSMASQASNGLLIGGLIAMLLGAALVALPMLGCHYMEEFKKRIDDQHQAQRRKEIENTAAGSALTMQEEDEHGVGSVTSLFSSISSTTSSESHPYDTGNPSELG